MTPLSRRRSRVIVVAWSRFQPRTQALGPALGGESCHVHAVTPRTHLMSLPLRYLGNAGRMWRLLRQHRPQVLVCVSPPVFAPMIAWLWCLTHRCSLVIDCHTALFYWWKWRWSVPIHRLLFRGARAILLHTERDAAMVRAWGARAVLLPDDAPDPGPVLRPSRPATGSRVVVAGSFDADEPVAAALAAAHLLPEIEVRLTGDVRRLSSSVRSSAPPNAVFTGHLPHAQFLGELLAADVIAAFSTDVHAMNRAAFEAIGAGRPLVLSDLPALRARFGRAALLCPNEPKLMAQTIRRALREEQSLAERSRSLRDQLGTEREAGLTALWSMLGMPDRAGHLTARASERP